MSGSSLRWERLAGWVCVGAVISVPRPVQAHASFQRAGEFVTGVLHPLTTPSHLLILLGLALLAGQHSMGELKASLAIFGTACAAALYLTTAAAFSVNPLAMFFLALVLGALVAVDQAVTFSLRGMLCAVAALLVGLDSAIEAGDSIFKLKILSGTWVGAIALFGEIPFYSSNATEKWMKIGIRVAGSWIAAISLLMLAFQYKSGR